MAEKPNFLNSVLQGLGLGKEPSKPQPKAPAAPTGRLPGRTTAPLEEKAEKAQDSKDRRFLISAYQTQPTLIPDFKDPQYMYKLISEECEYLRILIEEKETERKQLEEKAKAGTLTPREQWRLKAVGSELQAHQEDRNRFLPLLKKVTHTAPLPAQKAPEEKAVESGQRRYLIGAYEQVPVLISEFKDPQYMYRLFGEECDYTREMIAAKEAELKELSDKPKPTPRDRSVMQTLQGEIQALQADLEHFQTLRKKATERANSAEG